MKGQRTSGSIVKTGLMLFVTTGCALWTRDPRVRAMMIPSNDVAYRMLHEEEKKERNKDFNYMASLGTSAVAAMASTYYQTLNYRNIVLLYFYYCSSSTRHSVTAYFSVH